MGRTIRNSSNTPNVKPVEKIELSEKHLNLRIVLVVLFLAIGAGAIAYGVNSLLSEEPGWQTIEADSGAETNCSGDFVFLYNLGASGVSATAEQKLIISLYTDATQKAYQLFQSNEAFEGVNNIYYINQHPNQEIVVDEVLYEAFTLLDDAKNRNIYLAPIYTHYDDMFYCVDDALTADFDPFQNETVAKEYAEVAAFACDSDHIDVQLLGNNKIKLYVSDAYMEYADENFITDYIDFFWMKNAFIIDYLADTLSDQEYVKGSLSSFDGFVRNLDDSDTQYSFNIFDMQDEDIYGAGVMQYTGARSIVYLRNYMMNTQDMRYYYEFENGETRTSYLDVKDGINRSAVNNLVAYSDAESCAEILMEVIPVYIADTLKEDSLSKLKEEGIYSVYCKDSVIYYNDPAITLTNLYNKAPISYSAILTE